MSFPVTKNRAVTTDLYSDLSADVERIANSFAKRHRWDRDECISTANMAFLEAVHKFDPDQDASINTWLYGIVWRRLVDMKQKELSSQKFLNKEEDDYYEDALPVSYSDFDVSDFKAGVGRDSEFVINLLLNSPEPLAKAIALHKSTTERGVRRCLRRYLKGTLGWGYERVRDVFQEIREALK